MKNVLVIGGAGYIGSHTVKLLKQSGYNAIIYDNLSKGHKEVADILDVKLIIGDLGDREKLKEVFETEKIDVVMHFAAFIEVGESVTAPGKYYENNVAKVINLLNQMVESNIKNFVFSSTAATFGNPQSEKISETHPQNPINPYGSSKRMVEIILKDFEKAYGLKSVILRYFNAAGADMDGLIGESHSPESHLIPVILEAASGKRESIKIFGTDYETEDGTCIRDYIHVYDLAKVHIMGMEKMLDKNLSLEYNLGNGKGFSVRSIIDTVKKVTKKEFKVVEADRRPGDPAVLIADPTKLMTELKWVSEYSLDDIISSAWLWEQNRKY
ncbi:UDP-glucose 4-epimerase GalE [Streptobacillus moniliformis]|uniref:UDP-glucose 4-epimerase n=1 Tax=Streptobacillus moniliformis (strain ATCC 14647 / DSM 12112 / NCTC 10651 / 9901) TaxID=519441 RepID=D1AWY0_STRM9|nr:UDP-glucose 4-epimerase GalE [Streptobacillus moniliformis]ACZ00806.1 UDP-glucose 4-epimerase [Streptobacillus moniliformis DSM 12112]AVL42798.1 UDP-glucose 4-epimerase GalE [Streptobacillus moniliformis]QXW65557.1 UDP-glucose 4-epimerase GalE [Streptobacillus moniliformis]SQA14059.1 UDP-glucose 4-epimerase [Streptobacillus moniliformis]